MSVLRLCATARGHLWSRGVVPDSICAGQCLSRGGADDDQNRLFWSRGASGGVKDKEPLRKAKTPQGRFDRPEETSADVLQSMSRWSVRACVMPLIMPSPCVRAEFPDDVNPVTKEKGGPRGPEPTRYGDWERKGRCVDF
ncbi:succinate dehydrogenase assembly factor 4, mitochondrial [Neosynchiropus ocellatus]